MRSLRNRSILGVCEDFENERNDKVALLGNFHPRGYDALNFLICHIKNENAKTIDPVSAIGIDIQVP